MIYLRHSLFLLFGFIFFFFSYSILAKEYIPLGICGSTQSKYYKSIVEIRRPINNLIDKWVVIEGIVTLEKLKEYEGFWVQQENTFSVEKKLSHGIFIYHPASSYKTLSIQPGQHVRLLAQVAEYHGLTELKSVRAFKVCASDISIPKASLIMLPILSRSKLEALEGMRVSVKSSLNKSLVISDLFGAGFGLGNYGQFAISSQLHFQPTELYRVEDILSHKVSVVDSALDYLLVDDGYSIRSPKFIPFPNKKGFSAENPLRIGDEVEEILAVLHRYRDHYILIPEEPANNIEIKTQLRPGRPIVSSKANTVIASINVENYFNGNPKSLSHRNIGFPTSRGAKTYSHFMMQTQKLVAGLSIIDADVIALMEIENDGYGEYSAIADLTRALNKKMTNDKKYRYVIPKQKKLGGDKISVGILYRSHKVTASGEAHVLDYSQQIRYQSRPSLLQKFIVNDQPFYLVVNHFKSKGGSCDSEFRVPKSIQGSCNGVRIKAASILSHYINQKLEPAVPVLIIGDFNSYSKEDPLLALAEAGYTNINSISDLNLSATPIFSYSFQGYLGNLDHALANTTMLPFVRSIDSWSINSVEDVLLKYDSKYAKSDAYRSSDHDPIVIGIEF